MSAYVYLGVAIFCEVVATTLLKASDGLSRPLPVVGTVIGYVIAFFCLSLTLKSIPTGVAYAIWSGVGIVLISVAGWIFFKQRLDAAAIAGMALIAAGVAVINLYSKSVQH